MPEKSGRRHALIQSAGMFTRYLGPKKLSPVTLVPMICVRTASTTTHSGAGIACIQRARICENPMRNNKLPMPTMAERRCAVSAHSKSCSELKNSTSNGMGEALSGFSVPIITWLCLARMIIPMAASMPCTAEVGKRSAKTPKRTVPRTNRSIPLTTMAPKAM